uniref:Endonuclease/exonuclease/phosphatase domain-containing protein n=1 Tax=Daphnia galeata TaxID=27404 RepID=A0A8J2RCX1_9CRUS|nr:unnamed protein product [Daphnia galeata]
MKIAERDVMKESFIAMIGTPRDSEIRRGGDLFVHPVDSKQQEVLLNIKQIAGRPVSCSLPNSFRKFKGRIQGVPVEDTIEEIKKALENQDVVDAFRPKNPDGSPSEKIILTFASGLPGRVKISSMSYDVRQYFPTPFRCRLCWRLGHTHSFCGSKIQMCKKCGQHHETGVVCQQRCVNCGKSDHESDSAACPSYVELRNALKIAVMENITVKEARMRSQSLYSTIARSPTAPSPADNRSTIGLRNPTTRPPEITLLQAQVAQLQTEMNMMKEATIPNIVKEIRQVASEVEATKANFGSRFDRLDQFMLTLMASPLLSSMLPISPTPGFSVLPVLSFRSIEVVSISISSTTFPSLDIVSVYAPKGDSSTEEILNLFTRSGPFIIGGDFNAHHAMWESEANSNRGGLSIWTALMELPDVSLLTPMDFGTRIDPMSVLTSGRPQRWIFAEEEWGNWNTSLSSQLQEANFMSVTEPEAAYSVFYEALLKASVAHFRKTSTRPVVRPEAKRPWWDAACTSTVQNARRAYREWRTSPLSAQKRENWKKAEAQKRKHIIQAKRAAWRSHLSNLDSREDPAKLWNFVKAMLGKKVGCNPLDKAAIKDSDGHRCQNAQDKANLYKLECQLYLPERPKCSHHAS